MGNTMENSELRHKHGQREKKRADIDLNLEDFTMKDFRVFLILLLHSGEDLSDLSKVVNAEFNLQNRTKGYDYIKKVCKAGYAYKRRMNVNGKKVIKVYVSLRIRKAYNNLFAPTIENTRKVIKEVIKDYLKEFNNINRMSQTLVDLSENTIKSIEGLISKTPIKLLTSEKFIEKLSHEIRSTCRSELIRLELFSKRFQTQI